jgi:hypothetical protein
MRNEKEKGPPAFAGGPVVGGVNSMTKRRGDDRRELPNAYECLEQAKRFLIETPD